MPAIYTRILDLQKVQANFRQTKTDVVDVGACSTLVFQVRVAKAGTAGALLLQEAAVNEDDAFINITGASLALNATSNSKVVVSNPLRYIRVATDSNVASDPQVLVDLIGRE
jgi:hypothetical protein